jgi:hypothetical protein
MPSNTEREYASQIECIQSELTDLQKNRRIVTTPAQLEQLEHDIRRLTDRLAAAILGHKVQESLDSGELADAESTLIKNLPKRLKSEGKKSSHHPHLLRR